MNSKTFYPIILFMIIMTLTTKQEMSKSLCGNCKNYLLEPDDKYGSWCVFYRDIFQAIQDEKIIVERKSGPIDRSVRYNIYGLVYCEGYKPK